jgi:hypothetical protein
MGAVVTALTLVVGMSGCFGFMGIRFSRTNLAPSPPKKSKTVAKVTSQPIFTEPQKARAGIAARDYPFFLIRAVPEGAIKFLPHGARFDVPGEFGPNGGRRLVRDQALEQAVADQNQCGDPAEGFRAYRTERPVNDHGNVKQSTFSTLPFRQTAPGDPYVGPGVEIQLGGWSDDGDGVPEFSPPDELFGCNGGGYFNLELKDDPNVAPRRSDLRGRSG